MESDVENNNGDEDGLEVHEEQGEEGFERVEALDNAVREEVVGDESPSIAALREKTQELLDKVSAENRENRDLRRQLGDAHAEVHDLRRRLGDSQAENHRLREAADEHKARADRFEAKAEAFARIKLEIKSEPIEPTEDAGAERSSLKRPRRDVCDSDDNQKSADLEAKKARLPEQTPTLPVPTTSKSAVLTTMRTPLEGNKPVSAIDMDLPRCSDCETEHLLFDADVSQDVIGDLSKKIHGILDKPTPQMFDALINAIDTEEKLRTCVDLVFNKAVDKREFSAAYARMCEVLQKKQVQNAETGQPINFRKLLIARCQQEFERDYMDGLDKIKYEQNMQEAITEERKKELRLEFEDKERRARRRSLGNMRFIGELYKLKMLTARIMHECVMKLLKTPDKESLEDVCQLLGTVGKYLEIETNAKIAELGSREAAAQQGFNHLDTYFDQMQTIIYSKSTSTRTRSILQGLTWVRLHNWPPRCAILPCPHTTETDQIP